MRELQNELRANRMSSPGSQPVAFSFPFRVQQMILCTDYLRRPCEMRAPRELAKHGEADAISAIQ